MEIPRFQRTASAADVAEGIKTAGCAIIEHFLDDETVEQLNDELNPYFDRVAMSEGSFMGVQTQRMSRIIAKSKTSHELLIDPMLMDTVDGVLRGESYHFTLHHTEASRIHPGQPAQSLHRDDTTYPFTHPCRPVMVATIWALGEFTRACGATQAVPGSHLWDDVRKPTPEEVHYAEMPKGSMFLFDSAIYHGGGCNSSEDEIRKAMIIMYGLGWLRPAENQILAVPPALARTLPTRLQELVGYRNHGYLGHYELGNPAVTLKDPIPETLGAVDLYDDETEQIQVRRR
ncbi:phytanoyl-CoA dioxygenase family protein [Haliangium ochraceum]|uniref:Phytanoyl-CoA dioxygenase n=1 Tax=Haliangium ochraceum (strain DSM 14365 / JCM 11303 / SMP-2) TaxID=502025 RepID=D0LH60_HALO1|nr:phytanoyl-CoA dioxygenase family protein [Haliangium ochraceum]ACY18205.1 Phytanoyl-CoA dioxygenase [Haliangium ochraceum DSM 14365]